MYQSLRAILAASFLVTSAGIASAVPARVETDLNVRVGPSTGYGVVGVLPAGAIVDVLACYQGWCEIVWEGFDGFASRAYLDIPREVAVITPPASAVVVPGIVVYESRYFERPVWSRSGRIIREAIRRDIRRDRREVRQDRREDRREVREERRRKDRIEARQERRNEARQDRRRNQVEAQQERRREIRRDRRDDRVDTRRERRQDARTDRRQESQTRVRQKQRAEQSRAQARQERRPNRPEARQKRQDQRETMGYGSR